MEKIKRSITDLFVAIKETAFFLVVLAFLLSGRTHRRTTESFSVDKGYPVRKCKFKEFRTWYGIARLNGFQPVLYDDTTIINHHLELQDEISFTLTLLNNEMFTFGPIEYIKYLRWVMEKRKQLMGGY